MERRYLIIGAARSGIASAKYLLQHGANVVLSDMNERLAPEVEAQFEGAKPRFIWGQQPDVDAIDPDVIVMSPGVPMTIVPVARAHQLGIPVIAEPELAFSRSDTPFIAITGTNGKTTTTALTAHLLETPHHRVVAAGNIGLPLISQIDTLGPADLIVAEMSSFQLESVDTFAPDIAVVLNLSPDHLDRHKTMEGYIGAKANVFKNQTPEDYLVLNMDDTAVCDMAAEAASGKWYFSLTQVPSRGIWRDASQIMYRLREGDAPQELTTRDRITIPGDHNLENAMAAALVALLLGQRADVIAERLTSFKGVPHRIEEVATVDGVRYINDSKGTNPDAADKALASFAEPIVLLAGGRNKGSDFVALARHMAKVCRHVVLFGEAVPDFLQAFSATGFSAYSVADGFDEAVQAARLQAKPGDVVLLSPACTSWDMFTDYEARGDRFKKLVKEFETQGSQHNN